MNASAALFNIRSHSLHASTSCSRPGSAVLVHRGCSTGVCWTGARAFISSPRTAAFATRTSQHIAGLQHRSSCVRPRRQQHLTKALFTGIVQGMGKVTRVEQRTDFRSIDIHFPQSSMAGIQIGASVSINGTCLTVTHADGDKLTFDIISETLRATNLGVLQEGSSVNFERSARVGDEIGGHNVSGHVCSTVTVSRIEDSENNRRLTFSVPAQWMKYVLPKGFIAVDGISLTVGEVGPDWFSVYLIPETLRVTTLGSRAMGDSINLEVEAQTQAIVDTVESVVARYMAERVPA